MRVYFRWSSLNEALRRQDFEDVRQWLSHSSSLFERDWAGRSPLHAVSSVPLVKLLLGAGANLNAKDNAGLTAFDVALRKGNTAVALALLQAGAQPSATSLHWAAWKGSVRLAEALLAKGLSATGQDARGQSPLHWVFRSSHSGVPVHAEGMVRLLLENGASWETPDRQGKTPRDLLDAHKAKLAQWPVRLAQTAQIFWLRMVGKKTLSATQRLMRLEKVAPSFATPMPMETP
jgi:26S proteasome non-ATPase regulatory subunit 10